MKKIALLFLTSLILWSCGDEVEFSTPGFQGKKNYNLWRANYFSASLVEGGLVISAGVNSEEMTFTLPSANGTFPLADTSVARADFMDFQDLEYSTANTPDPSVSLYPEIGEVIITESTAGYVSGSFRFNAFTEDGMQTVGFHEGVFYRVPIGGGTNTNPGTNISCQEATANLATASTNFAEVQSGDPEYVARCNAYRTALEQMIEACGDPGGALQTMLNNLTCN